MVAVTVTFTPEEFAQVQYALSTRVKVGTSFCQKNPQHADAKAALVATTAAHNKVRSLPVQEH